jgi:hypothetical protein
VKLVRSLSILALQFLWAMLVQAQPNLTPNQWTAVGSNTYYSQIWRDGSEQDVGQIKGNMGSAANAFAAWVGGDYDTQKNELNVLVPGGDQDWSSNEVINFNMASRAWKRDVDPTTGLVPPNSFYGPSVPPYKVVFPSTKVPLYFNDSSDALPWNTGDPWRSPVNTYPNNAVGVTDIYTGLTNQKLYPGGRHTYDAITFMGAPVNRFFLWGGAGGQIGTLIPMEYDPATKKYEFMTDDWNFRTTNWYQQRLGPVMTWDSNRKRVLVFLWNRLLAYDPRAAKGSRITAVGPDEGGGTNNYSTMFFDPKRNKAIMIGAGSVYDGQSRGMLVWDFSKGPTTGAATKVLPTGDLTDSMMGGLSAPGARYDPIGDQYVIYNGRDPNALYFMNPDTLVTKKVTFGGATVTSSFTGNHLGNWKRFFYSPDHDVFGIAPTATSPVYLIKLSRGS